MIINGLEITSEISYKISILVEDHKAGLITQREMADQIGDLVAELVMSEEFSQFVIYKGERKKL